MDDFYSHINKKWFDNFVLPDDHVRYTSFDSVTHKVRDNLLKILNEEKKNLTTLGKMCIKLSEETHLSYFEKYFDIISGIETFGDFIKVSGTFAFFGTNLFFNIGVGRDFKHSNNHIMTFAQSGCTLPSKSYYTTHKDEYLHFLSFFCPVCDINIEPIKLYDLEKQISDILMSMEKKRNIKNIYNVMPWQEFLSLFSFDMSEFFHMHQFISDRYNTANILVDDKQYITELCEILKNTDIDTLKCYLKFKFILTFPSICLPNNISSLIFNFFKKELLGVEKEKSNDEMIISYINMFMPEKLGEIYNNKHFSNETKEYIYDMIDLIKLSAKNIINDCYWMSGSTKEKSVLKVEGMNVKVGGPENIRDYSEFASFVENNSIEMTMSCFIFYTQDNYLKLGTDADREKWSMASYSVNAYYSPLNNEIVIPAGILNFPFYSPDNDLPSNLGAIGSVIAHEISHGFDDQGSMFDVDGNYKQWWEDEDLKKYNLIIKNFKHQYNSVTIMGNRVSGDMTIGENIADYTGMVILTNILKINGSPCKDYATMYTNYAVLWRQKIRDKEMVKRLKTDVHAPPRLRTNIILSNIPDFIRVFNITPEHKMYISETKRFKLWK